MESDGNLNATISQCETIDDVLIVRLVSFDSINIDEDRRVTLFRVQDIDPSIRNSDFPTKLVGEEVDHVSWGDGKLVFHHWNRSVPIELSGSEVTVEWIDFDTQDIPGLIDAWKADRTNTARSAKNLVRARTEKIIEELKRRAQIKADAYEPSSDKHRRFSSQVKLLNELKGKLNSDT